MLTIHKKLRLVPAALLAAVLAWPATTYAAKDELITTTARGRTESVQDVPATIAVIGQDEINSYGVQRIQDVAYLVPGVTIVDAAEVGDTQINIRGINGARDAENSIALVIDGVLMTNPAAVNREYTNLQQIEIMKGPQGALYGRNAAAGAFIVTTQAPTDEFSADFRGKVAEDETYQLIGSVAGPIGDSIGWRVGADFSTSDGYYTSISCTQAPCSDSSNIASHDGVTDSFEGWNVDGRLVWDLTDSWSLDGKFRYGEVDANSITFNSVFHLPLFADLGFGDAWYEDVNEHPFGFNPNIESTNDQEATELSIRSTTDLAIGELAIWGLYSNIENSLGADGTSGAFGFFFTDQLCLDSTAAQQGFPLNPPQFLGATPPFPNSVYGAYTPTSCDGTQYQERNQKDFSFEVRLTSDSAQSLRWSTGLYYLNIDRQVGVNTGVDSGQGIVPSLYVPNGGMSGVNNATEQLIHDQFDSDVYAVFGSIDWDLSETLTAGFALRYDKEERKAKSLVPTAARAEFITCGLPTSGAFTDPINPGLCPDVNPSGEFTPRSKDFDEWQPKITLTWDIYPTLTAFASYGVGFKSGGFNNQGSQATVDKWINSVPGITSGAFSPVGIKDDFDKETSGSAEIGFKSNINDGAFRWEASLYRVDVDDMQFFEFLVGPFGLLRVVENIDKVEITGVEISGVWSPTDTVNLFAGGNWLDSEIEGNTVRPDTVGNKSPYTPEWTFNAGGDMSIPMTASLNLIGSLDFTGVGKTWFHAVQAQERPTGFGANGEYSVTQRDVYWLTNARLGVGGEKWSVVVFGRNIGDEEWLQEVIPAPEFGGSFTHPGTLARWGLEATFSF